LKGYFARSREIVQFFTKWEIASPWLRKRFAGKRRPRDCKEEEFLGKGKDFSGRAKEKIGRGKHFPGKAEDNLGLFFLSPGMAEDFSGKAEEKNDLEFLRAWLYKAMFAPKQAPLKKNSRKMFKKGPKGV